MSKRTNADNEVNRFMVRRWMQLHAREYTNSTNAAENCANDLDLCDDDAEATIPEYVFEIALEYVPNE